MVYCSKCGTQNPDTNVHCSNCGAPLYTVGQKYPGSDREHYRKMENECFGLPNGGIIVTAIFGIIIVLFGLGFFIQIDIWPLIIIIFGLLLVIGALYRYRRYSERHPT